MALNSSEKSNINKSSYQKTSISSVKNQFNNYVSNYYYILFNSNFFSNMTSISSVKRILDILLVNS